MSNACKLGLGTVQWGIPYGLSNQNGVVTSSEVTSILNEAKLHEVEVLDTAALYGKSEIVLGGNLLDSFKVVTKTPNFSKQRITNQEVKVLNNTFKQSLGNLCSSKVYGLLTHNVEDLLVPGGEKLVDEMLKLKQAGMIEKIGISVYDSTQIDKALKIFCPDLIQLPLNVLDQRMLQSGHLEMLNKKGIEIYARSVFLQGLLLMPLNSIPPFFDPIRHKLEKWHAATKAQGFTLTQAAMSFVKNISDINTMLIGVDSTIQFRACSEDFIKKEKFDSTGLYCNEPLFVNPSLWQLK